MKKLIFFILIVAGLSACTKEQVEIPAPAPANAVASDRSVPNVVCSIQILNVDYPYYPLSIQLQVRDYYTNALVWSEGGSYYLNKTFSKVLPDKEYKVFLTLTPWHPEHYGKLVKWNLKRGYQGATCTQGPSPDIVLPFTGAIFGTGDSWEPCFY